MKLRRFFGSALVRSDGEATLVLDTYLLDKECIDGVAQTVASTELAGLAQRPYIKRFPGRETWRLPGARGYVLGYCTARGLAYLLRLITNVRRSAIDVKGDEEAWTTWGGTVISIGGPAASMHSRKILEEYGDLNIGKYQGRLPHGIHRKSDGAVITDCGGKCYGLIAKHTLTDCPEHRLIVCAGIGEWGTSGACWCLGTHWQELYKKHKARDFAVIVEVDHHSDHSARVVDFDRILALQSEPLPVTGAKGTVTAFPRSTSVTGDIMPASGSVTMPAPAQTPEDRAPRRRRKK